MSNNTVDQTNDLDVAPGIARDSINSANLVLAAGLTKKLDAAWTEGNNAGGLFSGTKQPSTWYHAHLIRKDSDGTIDTGFDTSVTAANKPAGWSNFRRLGAVLTDGTAAPNSGIIPFVQNGDRFLWKAPVMDVSAVGKTTLAALHTLSTPLGVITGAIIAVQPHQQAASTITMYGLVTSPLQADTVPSNTLFNLQQVRFVANYSNNNGFSGVLETNTVSQIRTRFTQASGVVNVLTMGWVDPRGKE